MLKVLCGRKKKVNKKGFTIVELLVSVAIMAVISLILAQFVAVTTNTYRKASSQTKVQETCRDALTQISNIVRNSKSLKVTKGADGSITMESEDYQKKKTLLVYVPANEKNENNDNSENNENSENSYISENNDYGRIYVCYDYTIPEAEESKEPEIPDITANKKGERYNEYLLTDMVKDFTVDYSTYKISDTESKTQERTLDLVLTLEKNDREYTQRYKASLRNSRPEGQKTELVIQIVEPASEEEQTDE